MFYHLFQFKYLVLLSYLISIPYIHFRGKVRLKALRQLTDHSSILAPINCFIYAFSAVSKTPYLNLNDFPQLDILKKNWQIIRDEALILYQAGHIDASKEYDDIGFNSFFRRGWKRFYLKWYDNPLASAQQLCPKTTALIQQIPNLNAAMFAMLPKQSYLFKHRDPYAGSLRYHLGLITPNSDACCLFVDGVPHTWKDGQGILFDETYVHWAENKTDTDRIILFCDIKRPFTNRIANTLNHVFCNTIMRAAASRNMAFEEVGTINKIFGYLYQVRLIGKRFKKLNRTLYYLFKYSALGALFYWIFIR